MCVARVGGYKASARKAHASSCMAASKVCPPWGKGPAVTLGTRMQAEQLIMRRFDAGAWKELVVGPVLDQESSTPHRGQLGQSISDQRPGTWSSQECVSSSFGTSDPKVAIMQLTTDAVMRCCNAASSRLRPPRRRNRTCRIRARDWQQLGRGCQRTASLSRTGPVLPRRSILGRKKIAWPGARPFSRSHIRCQACSPSSVPGTDAVVRGGVI
jgi:hypothetical protein